ADDRPVGLLPLREERERLLDRRVARHAFARRARDQRDRGDRGHADGRRPAEAAARRVALGEEELAPLRDRLADGLVERAAERRGVAVAGGGGVLRERGTARHEAQREEERSGDDGTTRHRSDSGGRGDKSREPPSSTAGRASYRAGEVPRGFTRFAPRA